MALNFPKLPIFKSADTKSRIFLVLAGMIGIVVLIYAVMKMVGGGSATVSASRVTNLAAGLQSVPGSQLSPEYYQALRQSNNQAAQQAQMTGGSAVPTLMNVPNQPSGGNCTVLCPSDDNVNVASDISDLVKAGKLSQDEADKLIRLADKNVPNEEYAATLNELVRQGKLTPDEARKLLEHYKKQRDNVLLNDSARMMDGMIKGDQLSLDAANMLLGLQKKNLTPMEYANELSRLVKSGKISEAAAARLLAQYKQQQQKELTKQGLFDLQKMVKVGEVTSAVAKNLAALQEKNVPVNQYEAELSRLVKEGQLTPAAAAKLLAQYKQRRANFVASGMLGQLSSKEEAKRLLALQENNTSLSDYATELKRAVVAGLITPQQAADLLKEYQATITPVAGATPTIETNIPGTEEFTKLQQQVQQQGGTALAGGEAGTAEFLAAQQRAEEEARQAAQQRIQDMQEAMSAQAQQLVNVAWQPSMMKHVSGSSEEQLNRKSGEATARSVTVTQERSVGSSSEGTANTGIPLIKAGTIIFAVLDTAVDSDYPDTPVMATVIQGEYKGAKLLGRMQKGAGPMQDKVSLTFNLMSMDRWPSNKSVTAFAIDPDTARTAIASGVDHHYMMRYGAIMATSFLSGYANAIMTAGSTSTTGVFGTTVARPELSPGNRLAVGLGQVGTTLGSAVQQYVNRAITVKVNAGVGLGILFMSDMS